MSTQEQVTSAKAIFQNSHLETSLDRRRFRRHLRSHARPDTRRRSREGKIVGESATARARWQDLISLNRLLLAGERAALDCGEPFTRAGVYASTAIYLFENLWSQKAGPPAP